ncbi:ATP phosphoribosyltransferase [Rubripirellula obstinata]|uniref:ATP phosphoribosyltransferase n=1 Tax=Rubripirellula obstinata TaxID=406547 RepID=A0A5B1CML4_9BACT|nr:ATP phosphoribosyltransferase [Rubripirellula obstinata]KAA1261592.1 ATP phosphoribosyltransferase [Rubripirellula obstinata]
MDSQNNLRIGVPSKGRLSEIAGDLLSQAGLKYRRQNRGLFARVNGLPIDIIFLRTDDIPTLCAEGAIDMGVTGSDLVDEAGLGSENSAVSTRMQLGVGRCRLAICVPDDTSLKTAADLDKKRIATSFPTVTADYLVKHNAKAHLVALAGSVEVMIGLGVADAIVDLVETGSTLAANRLKILEEIGSYETVLIQGSSCRDKDTADRVVRRLEGVVIARDYSLLEYNIPRSKLSQAEAITPGFNSPTVNSLENKDWCSIRVMVRRKEVIDAMEKLESLGASAIMETSISNCRL